MIRGAATLLLLLTSFVLGHAPCCVVGKQCCDEKISASAESSACSCCQEEREREPEPERPSACDCDCDEIVVILTLGDAFEFHFAALPFAAWNDAARVLDGAPAMRAEIARAPPRPDAGRTLPLLL